MKILLTGSNGLTGQSLTNMLAARDDVKLIASSRGPNRNIHNTGYEYASADLLDTSAFEALFEKHRPDILIHGAAMTSPDDCKRQPQLCDEVNVEATARLCQLCQSYGCRMIYLSTDFVFDGEAGPYRETDKPKPINYYGKSKLKAERLVQQLDDWSILRTILLCGEHPHLSRSNLLIWVKKSLQAGKPIRVVNDQWRCPTWVEDFAQAIVSAALKKQAQGIYHICGPELMRVVDVATRAAQGWGLDSSLITEISAQELGEYATRPSRTGFIIDKARRELGFEPRRLDEFLVPEL